MLAKFFACPKVFACLKTAVFLEIKKAHLEPIQSVPCGAFAGAISASLTCPLDVVRTRLTTQGHGEAVNKVAGAMVTGRGVTGPVRRGF